MRRKDPVANFEPRYVAPHLDDFTGDFVTEHQRRPLNSVPLHDVAAADAARGDLHQQVVIAELGPRRLFEAHVAVVVIHPDFHESAPLSSPYRAYASSALLPSCTTDFTARIIATGSSD